MVDESLISDKMYDRINVKSFSTRVGHIKLIGINSANVKIEFITFAQGGGKPQEVI